MNLVHLLRNTLYVAAHLGVPTTTINNWVKNTPDGFTLPFAAIEESDGRITRGWTDEQIASLRVWVAERLGLTRDQFAEHWNAVDAALVEDRRIRKDQVHDSQLLFDISA
ncbi:hypothetical protein ABT282_08190 [Streptomyces sp. NPDC000927]|uniref:hypothetical protein n=1 Tax=Streptomyces sp. NPDC000927 TaxID=3154371 RepID=UPI003320AAA2